MKQILTVLIFILGLSGPLQAEKIQLKHRMELLVNGTVTDSQGRVWKVKFLPGFVEPTKDAIENWKDSGDYLKKAVTKSSRTLKKSFTVDFRKFGSKELYNEMGEDFLSWMRLSRDSFVRIIYEANKRDWQRVRKENQQAKENGQVFNEVTRAANNTWFVIKTLGRGFVGTFCGVGSAVIGIIAPPARGAMVLGKALVLRPLKASWDFARYVVASAFVGVGGGLVYPGVAYVWNGALWIPVNLLSVVTRANNLPIDESKPGFAFRLVRGNENLVIDSAGLSAIVSRQILIALAANQKTKAVEEAQPIIDSIQKRLEEIKVNQQKAEDELEKERAQLSQRERQILDAMYANSKYKAVQKIESAAYLAEHVTISSDAEAVLDDEQLKEVVRAELESAGLEATDEVVEKTASKIREDVKYFLKRLEK